MSIPLRWVPPFFVFFNVLDLLSDNQPLSCFVYYNKERRYCKTLATASLFSIIPV